jgi:hypothetical protein
MRLHELRPCEDGLSRNLCVRMRLYKERTFKNAFVDLCSHDVTAAHRGI